MNQLVQVILANGQVVTTTLAALQQQQQQQQQVLVQPFVQHQQAPVHQLSPQQVQAHQNNTSTPQTTTTQVISPNNNQQCHMVTTFNGIQMLAQPAAAQLIYNPVTGQTQVLQFASIPDQSQQQQQQQSQQQQLVLPTVNGHQFINSAVMQQQLQQQQIQQLINQQNKISIQQQHQVQQQQHLPSQILQLVNQIPGAGTQVLVNPATGQIVGQLAPQPFNLNTMQMIPTISGQHQLMGQDIAVQQSPATGQIQIQPQAAAAAQQQQAQDLSTSDATKLHVQRVIQQQQQQILQQKQQQAHQQQYNHRQTHVNVLIEQKKRAHEDGVMKVLSPQGRVSSTTVNSPAAAAVVVVSKHQPLLILPAATMTTTATVIPTQTKATASTGTRAFHIVTNPVVEGRVTAVRETILPDAGVHDENDGACNEDADGEDDGEDGESSQSRTSLSSTPSSCSRMEPESTTHSDSSSQATIAHTINTSSARIVDGVNLEDVQEFARSFKMRRLQLGMTQTQVGNALALSQGPTYSQSAICRFEKLEISPKSALKIMPVLKEWMAEAEKLHQAGQLTITDISGSDPNKKRKRRTTFSTAATEHLNYFFAEVTQHPDSVQINELADKLNYTRETVRVWFCNRRQSLKKLLSKNSGNSISSIKDAVIQYDRDNGATTTNAVIPVS